MGSMEPLNARVLRCAQQKTLNNPPSDSRGRSYVVRESLADTITKCLLRFKNLLGDIGRLVELVLAKLHVDPLVKCTILFTCHMYLLDVNQHLCSIL